MKRQHVLAALAAFTFLCSCVKEHRTSPVQPGEPLPDFSVITIDGRTVSKKDLIDKPSVIILFDTRCPDCIRQLPEIEAVHRETGEAVGVLAVAREEDRASVASYWESAGYTIDVAAPGDRKVYDLFDRGSRSGVPLVYLSDSGGKVLRVGTDKAVLTADEITTILAETTDK